MPGLVNSTIESLRQVVGAKNEAELARKLGINQSTISAWRARGRVPERFVRQLEPENATGQLPQVWGELQDRAHAIALLRYALLRHDVAASGDVDSAIAVLRDMKPFWLMLHRAVHELRLKMEAFAVDLETAQLLLMQDDLRDPNATLLRVRSQLAEDVHDNPDLKL